MVTLATQGRLRGLASLVDGMGAGSGSGEKECLL